MQEGRLVCGRAYQRAGCKFSPESDPFAREIFVSIQLSLRVGSITLLHITYRNRRKKLGTDTWCLVVGQVMSDVRTAVKCGNPGR